MNQNKLSPSAHGKLCRSIRHGKYVFCLPCLPQSRIYFTSLVLHRLYVPALSQPCEGSFRGWPSLISFSHLVASYDSLMKQRSAVPSSTGAKVLDTSSNLPSNPRFQVRQGDSSSGHGMLVCTQTKTYVKAQHAREQSCQEQAARNAKPVTEFQTQMHIDAPYHARRDAECRAKIHDRNEPHKAYDVGHKSARAQQGGPNNHVPSRLSRVLTKPFLLIVLHSISLVDTWSEDCSVAHFPNILLRRHYTRVHSSSSILLYTAVSKELCPSCHLSITSPRSSKAGASSARGSLVSTVVDAMATYLPGLATQCENDTMHT